MKDVVFYAAVSTDGYIALNDKVNSVKWLDEFNTQIQALKKDDVIRNSYFNFIKDVDIILTGSKTYEDILSFGIKWPYKEQKTYVLSKEPSKYHDENIEKFINIEEVKDVIKKSNSKVFILGGGNLAGQLIDQKIINKLIITQMPILLGDGVRFFQNKLSHKLELKRISNSNNFVELEYEIKKD